jgi:hypothetical protein
LSRKHDVVALDGDEYDRLMDERELLRKECERLRAELLRVTELETALEVRDDDCERLRADAERIEFLESLLLRKEFMSTYRPAERVGSDLHIGYGHCELYMRDLVGNIAHEGHGDSVREAIDAAMKEGK